MWRKFIITALGAAGMAAQSLQFAPSLQSMCLPT